MIRISSNMLYCDCLIDYNSTPPSLGLQVVVCYIMIVTQ